MSQTIEPVFVAINLDKFWFEVKGKSNMKIACTVRKLF